MHLLQIPDHKLSHIKALDDLKLKFVIQILTLAEISMFSSNSESAEQLCRLWRRLKIILQPENSLPISEIQLFVYDKVGLTRGATTLHAVIMDIRT